MAFVATGGQKQVIRSSLGLSSLGDLQQRELQAVQRYAMAQQQQTERSQPHRFAVSEDTKAATHDFLSLYDKGSRQAENGASVGLSSPSLTTHDFLQPLERNGARSAYRESGHAAREKLNARPDSSTQSRHSTPVQGERVLPAALPNYTSIQVPYAVPPNSTIRLGGEAEALHRQGRGYPVATLSSREDAGGPDSVRGIGAGVDPESGNARDHLAYWPGGRFKFGLPSDLTFPGGSPVARSAVEIGHQSIPALAKQWAQAAQGMVEVPKQAARPPSEDEDEDEDSSERPKGDRKAAATTHRGDTAQRTDAKNTDMRGGTPRSKHSATEQRRRSKINDRFQMLRDLVPHSDQKRDKASFLLEVIDYIQALQEKVRKFETAEQARNQERLKSMVWDLCKRGAGGSGDETSQVNALVFAKDLNSGVGPVDMKPVAGANGEVHAPHACEQAAPVSEAQSTGGFNAQQGLSRPACSIHSCVSSLDGEKENGTALTAQPLAMGMTGQAIPLPYALPIVASKVQRDQDDGRGATSLDPGYGRTTSPDHQFEVRPRLSSATQGDQTSGQQSKAEGGVSGAAFTGRVLDGAQAGLASNVSGSRPPHEAPECRSDDMSKHARHAQSHQNEESGRGDGCGASPSSAQVFPRIQGGIINVSSVYSQGLLDTLTRALQSSGVDLSRANISVQIDLGKNATVAAADTSAKVATTPESSAQSHQSQGRTRPPATAAEAEPSLKRPKLETHE